MLHTFTGDYVCVHQTGAGNYHQMCALSSPTSYTTTNEPPSYTFHCSHLDEITASIRSPHIMWARNDWTTQQTANNRCRQNAHCHKEITRLTIVQNMWNFMLTSFLTLVSNSSRFSQNTLPPDTQMNNLVIQNRINIKCRQPTATINLTPNSPFKDNNYY